MMMVPGALLPGSGMLPLIDISFFFAILAMCYTFGIASYLCRHVPLHGLTVQRRCFGYADFHSADSFQPFHGPLVAFLAERGELLRIVYAADMVKGDVYGEHEYERISLFSPCREYLPAVIACAQIGFHLFYGLVLADFQDRFVLSYDALQYLPVDTCIVVFGIDKFCHFSTSCIC